MSRGTKVWIALGTVYVVWGSTYLGIKLAGETIPPVFAAGTRFITAGAIMAGIAAWRSGFAQLRVRRVELASAALVGVLLPGANALLFIAERTVPTGLASLIVASVPLWVVVLRLATRDRPDIGSMAGVALGFAGVAVLARPSGHAHLTGLVLVLLSAISWALGSFLSSRLPMPRDSLVSTSLEMLTGGVVLLPIGILTARSSELHPGHWSARSIGGWVYLVVAGSIVAYTAYAWLLANAPIGKVSTYAYVNPVVAILLGVVVLHEGLSWRIGIGAAVILASVALVVRRETGSEDETGAQGVAGAATARDRGGGP